MDGWTGGWIHGRMDNGVTWVCLSLGRVLFTTGHLCLFFIFVPREHNTGRGTGKGQEIGVTETKASLRSATGWVSYIIYNIGIMRSTRGVAMRMEVRKGRWMIDR